MAKKAKKTIDYKGVTYVGTLSCGRVRVFAERTAPGQHLLLGVYTPSTATWQEKDPLPNPVKEIIEKTFKT